MRKGASLWVDDESGARDSRVDLLQHCQPLSGDTALIQGQTCKIAARSRQVSDEARADRIANSDENNRNISALSSESGSRCCTLRHDHIGTQREKLLHQYLYLLLIDRGCKANIKVDIAALGPAKLL
jgi:hypothetical protein